MAADGVEDGSFGAGTDPKMASIFILSILNAVERWYRSDGPLIAPAWSMPSSPQPRGHSRVIGSLRSDPALRTT